MHTGCQEAKLLHLHLKTCPAGSNTGDCPMDYHGCDQSRKLLAHYRRCRTLRARQHANGNGNNSSSTTTSTASGGNNGMSGNGINNNNGSSSSSSSSSGHHCLVCSLMARQARTVLEHTSSSKSSSSLSTSGPNTKSIHPLKKNAFAVSAPRKMSYSLPSDVMSEAATRREKMNHTNAAAATTTTTTTGAMMPPPPPRRTNEPFPLSYVAKRCPGGSSNGGSLDSLAFLYATAKQLDGDGDDNDDCDDNQAFLPATTTIRRERAVSEAENTPSTVFRNGINTTSSGLDFSSVGLAMTTATTSTTAKRRERSASCGTIRAATRRTTTSPPTMSSISEEEPTMVVQELAEELAVDQGAR